MLYDRRAEHERPRLGRLVSMIDDDAEAREAGAKGQEAGQYPVGRPCGAESVTAAAGQTKAEVSRRGISSSVNPKDRPCARWRSFSNISAGSRASVMGCLGV